MFYLMFYRLLKGQFLLNKQKISRKSSTKFHFKVRKPNFKHRKALFKRGLERKFKNKNVSKFDVEKDGMITFEIFCLFKKYYPFKEIYIAMSLE